jgi:hypothetical protein
LGVGPHTSVSHDTDRQTRSLNKPFFTRELNPQQSPEARCA